MYARVKSRFLAKLERIERTFSAPGDISPGDISPTYILYSFMLNFRHSSKQNWARGYFESQVNALRARDKGGNRIDLQIIGNRKIIRSSIFNKIKVNSPSFLQILRKHFSVKGR